MKQFVTNTSIYTTADSGTRDPAHCQLGVFHTTENSDSTTPDAVAQWQTNPANQSSYNILIGVDGRTVRSNDDNYIPWSAGHTGNRIGIHASCIGRAARTRTQWLQLPLQITACAAWAADLNTRYGIPLIWLNAAQVRAGVRGFCGHAEISAAFHESDHTDPGKGFPADMVMNMAVDIATRPLDKDLPPMSSNEEISLRLDLLLDQLAGHPWPKFPGWPQLGGRSLVDAVALIGARLCPGDGFIDVRAEKLEKIKQQMNKNNEQK